MEPEYDALRPEYIEHLVRPEGMPPVNGYSHAVLFTGPMVVISGQVPLDADGNLVGKDDPEAQIRQVFDNLASALAAASATMAQVVKLTYFVTDMGLLPMVRRIRDEYVDVDRPPASSLVRVAGLVNPDFLIEIEALAATGD
jgi:enamine deaminase RidA (YjgF/YER057c/UK114 family)